MPWPPAHLDAVAGGQALGCLVGHRPGGAARRAGLALWWSSLRVELVLVWG